MSDLWAPVVIVTTQKYKKAACLTEDNIYQIADMLGRTVHDWGEYRSIQHPNYEFRLFVGDYITPDGTYIPVLEHQHIEWN